MSRRPQADLAGYVGGLALVLIMAGVDLALAEEVILTFAYLLGPALAGIFSTARRTARVAALAVFLAALSVVWNDSPGGEDYWVRLGVIAVAGFLSVLAAQARERLEEGQGRFAMLARLAEVADGESPLTDTIGAVLDILVPAFGDIALLDLVQGDEMKRAAVLVSGPDAAAQQAWMRDRPLMDPKIPMATSLAIREGRAQLVGAYDDATLKAAAYDAGDEAKLRDLGLRATVTVPLRARGRTLGALFVAVTETSGRTFREGDLRFTEILAGRVALALDNAGLYAELETMEAQLSAALGSLSDAVTVQTPQGRLIYANDVAADFMGFASAAELLATPAEQIIDAYESTLADGRPLTLADLPGRRVLAGEDPDPVLLRSVHRETGVERYRLIKSTAVLDRDGRPRLAVNVIEDVTDQTLHERGQALLVAAGEALASSLDYEHTLQMVAEHAVPELGDWCSVHLPGPGEDLITVAVRHRDPDKTRFARELSTRWPDLTDGDQPTAVAIRTGETQMLTEITDAHREAFARDPDHLAVLKQLAMRSALIVPLLSGPRVIGSLVIARDTERRFTEHDVRVAEELGRRAGAAVDNARLYTERSNIAATLQSGLLPAPLPDIPGWSTAALYRPAGAENAVGGDFYEAFEVASGWMVVVGDVAGRGAAAASVTAAARYTLRTAAQLLPTPLAAVNRLNEELLRRGDGALCTVVVALLRETPDGAEATVICAGHPPPVRVRGGEVTQVGEFGPMLGAVADGTWTRSTVPLERGDTLVLYTDGVLDTVGADSRFGEQRLAEALAGAEGPGDAVARVESAVLGFERGEQADDTAVVAVGRVA